MIDPPTPSETTTTGPSLEGHRSRREFPASHSGGGSLRVCSQYVGHLTKIEKNVVYSGE